MAMTSQDFGGRIDPATGRTIDRRTGRLYSETYDRALDAMRGGNVDEYVRLLREAAAPPAAEK